MTRNDSGERRKKEFHSRGDKLEMFMMPSEHDEMKDEMILLLKSISEGFVA